MVTLKGIIKGDSLVEMAHIPSESVDLILTDPPYNTGMNHKSQLAKKRNIKLGNMFNDSYTEADYAHLVKKTCSESFRVLKNNRACYIFISWRNVGQWIDALKEAGFNVVNVIVWDKVIHGLNYQNYAYTHEFIIFAKKGTFTPKNKPSNYWRDVWHMQRKVESYDHETIKPEKILREIIRHGSTEGQLVLDMFAGTGSTLMAAKQLKREYLGIEIDEKYIKIMQKRLEQSVL